MLHLRSLGLAAVVSGLLLAACAQPTPTPTLQATNAPSINVPATAYPADAPTNTQPAAYPAAGPTDTQPAAYPAATEALPTNASSATPSGSPTEAPAPTAASGPVVIVYRNFEIQPALTTIKAGTEVTFLIENGVHQPYAGSAAPFIFESPPNLGTGALWSHTFDQPGTLTILCGYHAGMSATLVIAP